MGKEILSTQQVGFLDAVANFPELARRVYLTGGTALAAFYLNHRESEDLDFFSEEEIEPLAIEVFLKSQKKMLGFDKFEFQKSFNRNLFFLHFAGGAVLKTEFTYFPFARLEQGAKSGNLEIDSMRDIAVNKVFTINQQTRARDFVDLYFILRAKKWQILDLARDARVKFDTTIDLLQLGAQFLQAGELKDFPRMRAELDRKELADFFVDLASSLKKEILY